MSRIELPFTVQNAKAVISSGAVAASPYAHSEIAEWCERFWNTYADVDVPAEVERIMPVLAEVETQWDLHLANERTINPQPPASE